MDDATPAAGGPPPPQLPPMLPPPPVLAASAPPPPPRPPARKGGRGWMVFSIVLLVLLGFSLLGNLGSLLLSAVNFAQPTHHASGPELLEVRVEDTGAASKIAIVDVEGIIFGGYVGTGSWNPVELVARQLERARQDPRVKAVILRIDSPGGEVLAADEIARAVGEFQDRTGKPVIAAMEGLAASGGYYVAAPCRWIVANELTLTGSIGVIMQGYNYRGLLDKVGVRPQVFKSGRFKDMLRGSKAPGEILPEEEQMIQALVDEAFARFKGVVARGRRQSLDRNDGKGKRLAADWETFADGRVLSGKQAHEAGFVDELGTFKTAITRAKAIAGLADANLIRYEPPRSLGSLLGLLGQKSETKVKVDLGFELPRIEAGRLYYLFVPSIH